jgi:hypothetical protein
MESKDYILRRDFLIKQMRKQNFYLEMGLYNEGSKGNKRGRKPAPSKRIEREVNTKLYSPKKLTNQEIDEFWD